MKEAIVIDPNQAHTGGSSTKEFFAPLRHPGFLFVFSFMEWICTPMHLLNPASILSLFVADDHGLFISFALSTYSWPRGGSTGTRLI